MRKKMSAFIRSKTVKGRVYWYLVSAFRVDGTPRQKVIGYLGDQRPESVDDALRIMKIRESSPARFKTEIGEMPDREFIAKHCTHSRVLDGFNELVKLLSDKSDTIANLRDLRGGVRGKGRAYREEKNEETGLSPVMMIRRYIEKIRDIDDIILKCCQFPKVNKTETRLNVLLRIRTRLAWRWQRASTKCRKANRVEYRRIKRGLDSAIVACSKFPLQHSDYFKGDEESFLLHGWELAASFDPRVLPDPVR